MEGITAPPLPTKLRKRTGWRQRVHLVDALYANLEIAKATAHHGILANARVAEFWTKLTQELNSIGPCARGRNEWKHVWISWCRKVRGKCRRISASLHAIDMDKDGQVSTEEHLNDVEMKILEIISRNEVNEQINSQLSKQNEKQKPHSTNCPLESIDYGSFPNQFENREEEMASSAKSRKRTSMDSSTSPKGLKVECRVCLQYVCCENQCCDIFDPWYQDSKATIASYFTQVTNIQVLTSDQHTKYICFECLSLLRECILFIEKAQHSEAALQKRYVLPVTQHTEPLWPKPIQVDKCLSNVNSLEVEVKQEVLSEDDVPTMDVDSEDLRMDIKVEPEEYASYCSPQIMDTNSQDETTNHSDTNRVEHESYLEEQIKEEPLSDNESEPAPDLPLDCMLCTKSFNYVSGLKAHVIAQHSYSTIARKTEVTPRIYQCITCRRTFTTHTDLIVHETCHGQYACYTCNSKFKTFVLLTKHSKRCLNNGDHVSRLKTLEDVKRPSPDPQHTERVDSTNTEIESPDGKVADSTNTEDSQKMHNLQAKVSTNTELKSQEIHPKAGDSTNTELKSQEIHPKAGDSTNTELKSQEIHPKAGDSIIKESELQKTGQEKTADSTELESQEMHHSIVGDLTNTESKTANSTNTDSQSLITDETGVTCGRGDRQSVVETIYDNSSQDSKNSKFLSPVIEENNGNSKETLINADLKENSANSEKKNPNLEENSHNSDMKNLDSETNNHNSENNTKLNNSDPVLDNSNSEIMNFNCKSTNQNQNLETQTSMDDSHIEISSERQQFNLTLSSLHDTNDDLNSPVSETNIINAISGDRSQRECLNTNSASPKSGDDITEMNSCNVRVKLNSDNVSTSENITAECSNLAMDNDNVVSDSNLESVVEMSTEQSQMECANIINVSKHNLAIENDSMEIHLAIHSLEKKSLNDLNVKIDEEVIETKESNEDKVLQ